MGEGILQYGLIGENLGHSHSARIHGLLGGYPYSLMPLAPPQLDAFMRRRAFSGINVTIPYKQQVLPYCDVLDERVQRIGAANTIVNRAGRLCAYNTDYDGLRLSLHHKGIALAGQTLLILGSGGSSQMLQALAQDEGAQRIMVASRTPNAHQCTYAQALARHDVTLIVNTTPVGTYPHSGASPINISGFPQLKAVVDLIYNPLKTALLLQAEHLGIPTMNGLEMLVIQAACAAGHFTGKPVPAARVRAVYRSLLQEQSNIVLIGMPGAGKSSLGKQLACRLGRPFVDMDAAIEAAQGRSIEAIFDGEGEAAFRALESAEAKRVGQLAGHIIATGGGTVLCRKNIDALRQNGVMVYIRRPLNSIGLAPGRPLAKTRQDLHHLAQQRLPLYEASADIILDYIPDEAQMLGAIEAAFEKHIETQTSPAAQP